MTRVVLNGGSVFVVEGDFRRAYVAGRWIELVNRRGLRRLLNPTQVVYFEEDEALAGLCEATREAVEELEAASGDYFDGCPLCGKPAIKHPSVMENR